MNDIEYSKKLFNSGADKILVNTSFYTNKNFIKKFVDIFGSQALVASIDSKKVKNESIVHIDRCRYSSGIKTLEWCKNIEKMGAGEMFLNSYENDGSDKGLDLKLFNQVLKKSKIPVILFGGVSSWKHLKKGFETSADAVAAANIFHYSENSTTNAKNYLIKNKINLRVQS